MVLTFIIIINKYISLNIITKYHIFTVVFNKVFAQYDKLYYAVSAFNDVWIVVDLICFWNILKDQKLSKNRIYVFLMIKESV